MLRYFVFPVVLFATAFLFAEENDAEAPAYLFTYFTKNGEDGLHLAWSRDGLNWKPLKEGKPFFKPPETVSKLVRDPSIVRSPDGLFHMVWTGSWDAKSIGYAASKDLIDWFDVRSLPVMSHEPTARNCWAPELFFDDKDETFHIVWSTTIPEKYTETAGSSETDYNHRMYCTSTKDFKIFTGTEPYWDPGHNVIDGFLAKDGDRYLLFYKDETLKPEAKKHILLATADNPRGPFEVRGVASHVNWTEGPTALKVGDAWLLYYDCYTKNHFGVVRSTDLKTWENLTDKLTMPTNARHGTTLRIDAATLQKLLEVKP